MSAGAKARGRVAVAEHRPANRQRRFRHDELIAVDLFSGFGGLSRGIEAAGFTVRMAANHNRYKVEVHEKNHPDTEHWVADLVDPDAADYHSARDLPAGDLLAAGVSCVSHSQANVQKAYATGASLFDMDDPEWDERVTRSERDRATALCVLTYAAQHHPRLMLIECTTELQSWGPAIPGKKKVGDGSTYRWWLRELGKLGYLHKLLFLNSMFFDVPQSRNRGYWCFWDEDLPTPDLEHRPHSWCSHCDAVVEARWTWKTGIPATGRVEWGKQYHYTCPSCRSVVVPPFAPSLRALDLTNLGTRIGDKPVKDFYDKQKRFIGRGPLAPATMARAERCRAKFADFPAVLMPTKAVHGVEKHPWQPLATQTSQQETSIVSTGAVMVAAGNGYEHPGSSCRSRGLDEPLWTQPATNTVGLVAPPTAAGVVNFQGAPRSVADPFPTQPASETLGLLASGIVPFRKHTTPTSHAEAMPTVTAEQIPGLLSTQGALFGGHYKQNGSTGVETAPHPLTDSLGTLTARDTTAVVLAEWRAALSELALEDCYFRMLNEHEVGRGCGFDTDAPGHTGTFIVWGSARDQVDGYGNAVSPQVGTWLGARLRAVLHNEEVAA